MCTTTSPSPSGRATVFCAATTHSPQSSGALNTSLMVEIELDLKTGTIAAVHLDPRLRRLQGFVESARQRLPQRIARIWRQRSRRRAIPLSLRKFLARALGISSGITRSANSPLPTSLSSYSYSRPPNNLKPPPHRRAAASAKRSRKPDPAILDEICAIIRTSSSVGTARGRKSRTLGPG